MQLHEPKRHRWLTSAERLLDREERDKRCGKWWVMIAPGKRNRTSPPRGRRGASWFIEVELYNGQRIFYRAY